MTADERTALKHLINQHQRRLLQLTEPQACAGCGTPHNNRTRGCKTCSNRHNRRAKRNYPKPFQRKGCCKGCGQPYYETTPDCAACKERHLKRRQTRKRGNK